MSLAVRYSRFGGPDVLEIVDLPERHPAPGEVRVAVRAAGLNPYDFKVRSTPGYHPGLTLPTGQGNEFAGIVDEIGDGTTAWSIGDEVLGWTSFDAQAEQVIVAAAHLAAKPTGLDWPTAGGIGSASNTASRATDAVRPGPNDTVLVSAAAGAVGLLAAQLARRSGAAVIGTASPANHDFLRSLGVIPVAYGAGLVERVRAVAPSPVTAVIDNAGEETVAAGIELGVDPARINSIVYYEGAKRYGISTVGSGGKTGQWLSELAGLAANGELVLPIAGAYPLQDVRAAYEQLESRHLLGKVVLTVD
jgi:NADPH:quinone reductase-like Zn-dependent oxidoreductase